MKIAKTIIEITIGLVLSAGCISTAFAAPSFDIDFYGGDTTLIQGEYDTGSSLELLNGRSVSVDILISGLEAGNGLAGWSLLLEYGSGLEASDLQINSSLWPSFLTAPDIQDGYLSAEGLSFTDVEGNDIILFSFDVTAVDSTISAVLTLWDYDKGGISDNVITAQGHVLDDNELPVALASVNSVPLPGAVLLLLSGLTALAGSRRE